METTAVIIPTFNRAAFLPSCLDSILSQTRSASEVIVVDDGSTDATPEVVARYGDRVRYVPQPNAGKAAALNLGLQQVRASLVWIVDDDDIVCPDALERLVGLLERNSHAGFAYGRHTRFIDDSDGGGRRNLGTGYWCDCAPEHFLRATLEDFFAHQPGMIVRRSLYDAVGGFDEALVRSQDYEMLIRLARTGACVSTDAVVFLQRQHGGLRGSSGHRLNADEVTRSWIRTDQKIFRRLHGELDLHEYLPRGEPLTGERSRRRALLQRGVIMARRKLWDYAGADFAAAEALGCGRLDDEERATVRRTFSSKYGCGEVTGDRQVRAALYRAGSTGRTATGLRTSLARGLVWRIRELLEQGRLTEAAALGAVAVRLAAGRRPSRERYSTAKGPSPREVPPVAESSTENGRSDL